MDSFQLNTDFIQLRIRRLTLFAFLASLMVHGLVLFAIPPRPDPVGESAVAATGPLSVDLSDRNRVHGRPGARAAEPQRRSSVAASPRRPPPTVYDWVHSAPKRSLPPEPQTQEKPADLQAYVNAARARRGINSPANDNQAATGDAAGPSEDEVRMANVMRNLRTGTNGVFEIISIGSRSAAFSFRGWTTDALNSRREYIPVDIGNNSSIELAIVRKMIELIRRYYKGNFNWESHRMDQIIVLSARIEDNEGLESFLLREFFGSPQRPATRTPPLFPGGGRG